MTIVDKPLVPGDEVREMLSIALSIRQAFENSTAYVVANDTGLYAYHNGSLALAVEKTAQEN
ncbi:MAG: hypothetical protein ACK4M3_03015, partial [Pyrobaculum sp.]